MSEEDGLIWGYEVDREGRGTQVGWPDLVAPNPDTYRWVHLELEAEGAREWIRNESGLGELAVAALLAGETRPRTTPMDNGLIIILRGVNLNPGADPEDMVSVRMWVEADRIITIRRHRLLAIEDLRANMDAGRGPSNVGEFVADLASHLVERMAAVLSTLDENLDAVEESAAASLAAERSALLELRRQAITLRRHLSPQRDALARLTTDRIGWLGEHERLHIREVLDRTTRFVEDLEAARERAAVTQEELANRLADQMNRRMLSLSIVAGIFLPLSFATGLLGINVGGIPGAEAPWAFEAVCASLVVLTVGEIVLFRHLRWM